MGFKRSWVRIPPAREIFSHGFTQMNTDCPWYKKIIRVKSVFICG